jgi:truncated hemoglobin YjbI
MVFDFLSRAAGGLNHYAGKSMVEVHKGRGINDEEFELTIGHIVQTMSEM